MLRGVWCVVCVVWCMVCVAWCVVCVVCCVVCGVCCVVCGVCCVVCGVCCVVCGVAVQHSYADEHEGGLLTCSCVTVPVVTGHGRSHVNTG
jgi:hypothetical protein